MSDEIDTLSDELNDLHRERRGFANQLATVEKSFDPAARALGALCMDPNNSIDWERTDRALRALRCNYELSKAFLEEALTQLDEEIETHSNHKMK